MIKIAFDMFEEERVAKKRKNRNKILFPTETNVWIQINILNGNLNNKDNSDQLSPDVYFRANYKLIREKMEELLRLLLNDHSFIVMNSYDHFIDLFITIFFGKVAMKGIRG
ncbi:MAG: hypothetical protein ACTSQK_03920 [Candidatus Heimdallarchaeota archaeon]